MCVYIYIYIYTLLFCLLADADMRHEGVQESDLHK